MTPALPAEYRMRGVRDPQDLDAVAALFAAADLVDVGFEDPSRPFIEENWRAEHFSPALDGVLIESDGALAAEGECAGRPGAEVDAHIRVHPGHRGRGLGSALLEWSEARALAHVLAGAKPVLLNAIPAGDTAAAALLPSRGYERARIFRHMERSLDGIDPAPTPPPGLQIRLAAIPGDLPLLHAVIEEAFAEHFGFAPQPFEEWHEEWMGRGRAETGLFLLAWEGDRLSGAAMSLSMGEVGWVGDLAVSPAQRGRGIGEALLRATFAAFVARGMTHARLNVDAGNETGATRLYERVGMSVRREWLVFRKSLPAH